MHAVFLTFEYAGNQLNDVLKTYTGTVTRDEGVATYTWMNDGPIVGGFYVFEHVDAAERFLGGSRMRALAMHPDVSDFYIQHFSTLASISSALPVTTSMLQHPGGGPGEACAIWHQNQEQPINQVFDQPA